MSRDNKRLQEFKGSGFEMVKGQPNIIGWQVVSSDGHRLGKIHDLIIDTVAQRVRYMVVTLNDNKILQLEKRTVLVPVGFAQLHPADDCVVLATVTPYQLRALPRYDKTHLGPKSEIDISQVFGREHSALGSDIGGDDLDQRFYDHDHFNDSHLHRRATTPAPAPRQPQRLAEDMPASADDPETLRRRHEQNLRDEEEARRRGLL